jgi:glyoxylase-like metal-dependent hydrolase (beta-lactamase superfamily II)
MENTFEHRTIPMTSVGSGKVYQMLPDLHVCTIQIVNVCFVGGTDGWVLVDAGMPNSADDIVSISGEVFGGSTKPDAIVLTHGHFDHVGSIVDLAERWEVPIYAHPLELPYLTGKADYPPPDPSVEGGLVTEMSRIFPHEGIDLGNRISALPDDKQVPAMPGWRWIHTPGHSPGHISLFRDQDRALIAGDAFVTVKQESVYKVFMQQPEISGPPRYFTTDWESARQSVTLLHQLRPSCAAAGHGVPMSGEPLSAGLDRLVREFEELAVPDHGRYVH